MTRSTDESIAFEAAILAGIASDTSDAVRGQLRDDAVMSREHPDWGCHTTVQPIAPATT